MIKNYIIKFLIGGSLITAIVYTTKYISPKLGAILYSFPIEFLIILFFMDEEAKQKAMINNSVKTTFVLVLFFIIFYIFLNFFNLYLSLILSILFYLIFMLMYLKQNKD